jgi:hypothetical protein
MEKSTGKYWGGAILLAAVLATLAPGRGTRVLQAASHIAAGAPCTLLAAPDLQLAGLQLSLHVVCDQPAGCALMRSVTPALAMLTKITFTSGNGE